MLGRHQLPVCAALLAAIACAVAIGKPPPGDPDRSYRAGIGLLNKGMHDLAAVELRSFLKEQPEGARVPEAKYALGVCLVKLGKHAEAASELDQVVGTQGFAFAPDAQLLRAQCASAMGEDAKAAEVLALLVKEHPAFAQLDRAQALLGESLYRVGKHVEAGAVLDGFASRHPTSVLLDRAEFFGALAQVARGQPATAAERLANIREKAPGGALHAPAALVEGQCRQELGELSKARTLYELASASNDDATRRDALLGLAQVARAAGDLAKSDECLDALLKEPLGKPTRAAAQIERARVLFDLGKYDAASAAFDAIAPSAPVEQADDVAYWIGKCRFKQGDFAGSVKTLDGAVSRFAKSELVPDMLFDRAVALAADSNGAARAIVAWEEWMARFGAHRLAPDATAALASLECQGAAHARSIERCEAFLSRWPGHARASAMELLIPENAYAMGDFARAERAYREFAKSHPSDTSAWRSGIRLGQSLLKLKRAEEGAGVLTPLLAVAPAPDGALRQSALAALADDSFARNDWKDAARWCAELGKGATSNDQIADALLRQGIACVRDGRAADALPLLSRVIDEFGETPQALHATFERGQLRSEAGSLHQARMDFEEVLSHERALPSPRFTVHALRHLASIASKEGRHDEAATILAQVAESPGSGDAGLDARAQQGATLLRAGNYADAERVLEAFTKGNPTHVRTPEAQVRLAIAMSRQGRHEESLAMLGTLDRPRLDADSAALAQYEVAWNQGALKREKEAREAYLVLLAGKAPPPLAGSAALELAQLELNANRPNDALPHLDRAREEASRSSGAEGDGRDIAEREVYLRGVCLLRVNRPRESAEALKTYRDTYPKSAYLAHAMLTRGEALLLAGNHKDACEELAQVATSPVTDSILDATLLRLAEAYAGAHQWEKSDKAYTKHAERFPKSEQWFLARFGQGWARENQSKFADAITIYKDIAERHQGATGARAQFQHGECLYAQKKLDDAVRELLKVDVLFAVPEWSAAGLYEAGRALRELGRTDEALRQFEDVVHRFPDSAWAKQAKDMLDAARPAALPGHQSAKPPAPLPTKPR